MNEPDIIFDDEGGEDLAPPKLDLTQYTEDEFRLHYKSTKKQYSLLRQAISVLSELARNLAEPGPLDIDPEMVDNANYLVSDFADLLEQMHLAAEWERDKH